jgi:hypothetical protein
MNNKPLDGRPLVARVRTDAPGSAPRGLGGPPQSFVRRADSAGAAAAHNTLRCARYP